MPAQGGLDMTDPVGRSTTARVGLDTMALVGLPTMALAGPPILAPEAPAIPGQAAHATRVRGALESRVPRAAGRRRHTSEEARLPAHLSVLVSRPNPMGEIAPIRPTTTPPGLAPAGQ